MRYLYIPAFTAVLLLSACETLVEVDIPDHQPRLVISSLFQADSLWRVHVTRSVPILSTEDPTPVENATLVVLHDGVPVDTLVPVPENVGTPYEWFWGTYRGRAHAPVIGEMYTLRASAPGFDTAEAVSTIPSPVPFSLEFKEFTGNDAVVALRLDEPAAVRNFYTLRVRIERAFQRPDGSTVRDIGFISFRSGDPLLLEGNLDDVLGDGSEPYYDQAFFSDEHINGDSYEIRMRLDRYTLEGFPDESERRVFVELRSITEDYFRYLRSLEAVDNEVDFFSEPAQIHGNVRDGFGIFAGSSAHLEEVIQPAG